MTKLKLYVCPVCGNIIQSTGEAVVSCCGITLPELEAEEPQENDNVHLATIEKVEDEFYITIPHEMTRMHYISFVAAVRTDGFEIKKLYPEQDAQTRFKIRGTREILYYCNHHGLFRVKL